jgi:hypothetical protein
VYACSTVATGGVPLIVGGLPLGRGVTTIGPAAALSPFSFPALILKE